MILFSLDEPSTTLWVSVYIGITALYFGKRVAQDAKSPLKPLKLPRYIIRLILLIIALILYIISLIMTLPSRDSLLGVVITILVFFGLGFRFTPPPQ